MRARIIKLVTDRGFGFAILDESGDDVFVHKSECRPREVFDGLLAGDEIMISRLENTDRGFRARGVTLA